MGKRKDIESEKKIRIEVLIQTGLHSNRAIAKKEKVSHQTVMRIANLLKQNMPSTSNKRSKCKGKRKTTPREDRIIVKRALENRRRTVGEIHRVLQTDKIHISKRTLQSRLYENNIRSRRPAKKPKLTDRMKKARLQWAKEHKNLTVEDWSKVCKL